MRKFDRVVGALLFLGGSAAAWGQVPAAQSTTEPRPAVVYLVPQHSMEATTVGNAIGTGWQPYVFVPPEELAQQYSCVIRLDSEGQPNPQFNPMFMNNSNALDSQSAVALLTSSALIDPAMQKTLGLSPAKRWAQTVVNVTAAGGRLARVEVLLRKTPDAHYPDDGARKTVDALIERLKNAYAASNAAAKKSNEARIGALAQELAMWSAKIEAVRQRQREIRGASAAVDVQAGGVGQARMQLNNLQNQRSFALSELTRNRAQLANLEPSTAPFEQAVKARQKELNDLKDQTGDHKATTQQIDDAESKLAEAQAQLAQAQDPQGSATRNEYQRQQIPVLKAKIAEGESRLKSIDASIAKLQDPKFQEDLDSLPDLQQQEFQMRSKVSEAQMRLDAMRRIDPAEPMISVTILDGSAP